MIKVERSYPELNVVELLDPPLFPPPFPPSAPDPSPPPLLIASFVAMKKNLEQSRDALPKNYITRLPVQVLMTRC